MKQKLEVNRKAKYTLPLDLLLSTLHSFLQHIHIYLNSNYIYKIFIYFREWVPAENEAEGERETIKQTPCWEQSPMRGSMELRLPSRWDLKLNKESDTTAEPPRHPSTIIFLRLAFIKSFKVFNLVTIVIFFFVHISSVLGYLNNQ